ncbi:hypothetical protein EVAR_18561_1 [Eumeta japonica]|uniref:Uncharacterized protein n=1 Tax=Eumeta variegata TaxID=151549 RepID=A0A4C1V483_EUMVA|nr:hypothetical protein EVAR_18561_1 [Eumeta japonica]
MSYVSGHPTDIVEGSFIRFVRAPWSVVAEVAGTYFLCLDVLHTAVFTSQRSQGCTGCFRKLNTKSTRRGSRRPYIDFVWRIGVCGACEADGDRDVLRVRSSDGHC